MPEVTLTIDGQKVTVDKGSTILQAARKAAIHIPTLCYLAHLKKPPASCRLCVVAVEGKSRLVASCVTPVSEGMVVATNTEAVKMARRVILELVFSEHYGDCVAPCSLACPAGIDIQGYVAHIAAGRYLEALELIKEKNPLPLSVGRVCPRFCESRCRRNLVDGSVAINHLKRFVADHGLLQGESVPILHPARTEHRVAIIGGGPAGLTAAYYLARRGHQVTIFEDMPALGGMLRYGIPEYRLPKKILDAEIQYILDLGVQVKTGQKWGKNFTLKSLKEEGFESVFMGIGAWKSRPMGIDGEELPGVFSGIDFLRRVAGGEKIDVGSRVAIIGGGNTAIDAARTCLRLGASKVTVIYRRSRMEMPASHREIREAEEEGVECFLMAAPTRIARGDGFLNLEIQRMKLGEPDQSGRRRPVPVPGSESWLQEDSVIAAIGQLVDIGKCHTEGMTEGLELTRWNTITADHVTYATNLEGVFAAGDAVSGPRTVIEAIAQGRQAADAIHTYLTERRTESPRIPFNITKGEFFEDVDLRNFEEVPQRSRQRMLVRYPKTLVDDFGELETGYTEEMAVKEAQRCLGCGCHAVEKCIIRREAPQYNVNLSHYGIGTRLNYKVDRSHPFITIDLNKCVLCRRCKNVCEYEAINLEEGELENVDQLRAISLTINDNCVFCGLCADNCPTGALVKKETEQSLAGELKQIKTVCPYCGIGCNLILNIRGEKLVEVTSDPGFIPNKGHLCVKGRFGHDFIKHPDRLAKPMIRRDGELQACSWGEALELIARRFKDIREIYGPESLGVLCSAKCSNEENYLLQKLARAVLGTNNVDHCARLCHSSTVAGLAAAFGSGAMTNSIQDLEKAEVILLTGSNITENHPIIGLHIINAVTRFRRKLIVVDPRLIKITQYADIYLRPKPGTDIAWLNGLAHVIIKEDLWDKEYVRGRTKNFEVFARTVEKYTPELVQMITGVPAEDLRRAARLYAKAERAAIVYCMGITQHRSGTDNVKAIANLAMLCGNVGIEGGGVNPLRGQNNVQGACDVGALPDFLPGYKSVTDPAVRRKFEEAWDVRLPEEPGLTSTEMINPSGEGKIKALYIMGENPLLSEPDLHHVRTTLEGLEFLVVQDIFFTQTAKIADVVLPAASYAEKEGTFTNTERRVQRFRQALSPLGESKPDWQIICELSAKMGYEMFYQSPEEIMEEIASVTPIYGGISYHRVDEDGIQWPCPALDHPGTPVLHVNGFTRGKGLFHAVEVIPASEMPDDEYPFLLSTGRVLYHYNSGTMSRRSEGLNKMYPEVMVEMNPIDAFALNIDDHSLVRIASRRGEITVRVALTERCQRGTVFLPFHFREAAANLLTNPRVDPISKIPEYKICAVQIRPVYGM